MWALTEQLAKYKFLKKKEVEYMYREVFETPFTRNVFKKETYTFYYLFHKYVLKFSQGRKKKEESFRAKKEFLAFNS